MSFLRRSVNDNYWRSAKPSKSIVDQFELPLGGVKSDNRLPTLCIFAIDSLHGSDLLEGLRLCRPNTVLDLREFSQFNIPGITRRSIFRELGRLGTDYREFPLPLSEMSIRSPSSLLNVSRQMRADIAANNSETLALFVSNEAQKEFASRVLLPNI